MKIKKRHVLRIIGIIMLVCGLSVVSVFSYKKISRELYMRKLLRENIIFEIPELGIKVPVLEGTDNEKLAVAAGHFPGTGELGKGNYCIAGHNSTIYAEIFNDLDQIKIGDELYLINADSNRTPYKYIVTEYKVVDPHALEVLNDYGDDRVTIISCTDDGNFRQVVVGLKAS